MNRDILGVELCGALKNVIAIAAGAADGLGFGDNGKAGLMTRGLAEMMARCGGRGEPLDVRRAGGSVMSSRRAGRGCRGTIGSARSWQRVDRGRRSRRRCPARGGAYTVDAALALAERYDVEMPIAREVHNALFEGKSVQRCLIDLLSRESKDELQDLG